MKKIFAGSLITFSSEIWFAATYGIVLKFSNFHDELVYVFVLQGEFFDSNPVLIHISNISCM